MTTNATPGPVDVTQAEKLFDAILGNVAAYGEWGTPSYREAALRDISAAFARHRIEAVHLRERRRKQVTETIFTPEAIAAANAKVEHLQRELDITNADHIALWLEANDPYDSDAWLAVQIVEAFERAINRKSAELGALEPMVQRSIMASAKLGAWLSAALEDPNVCAEMKADIREWFSAGEPPLAQITRPLADHRALVEAARAVVRKFDASPDSVKNVPLGIMRLRAALSQYEDKAIKETDNG